MLLFENGVGRPSNETAKKRNIFKGICVLLVVIIILLVAYLLSNKNANESIRNDKKDNKEVVTITTSINKCISQQELSEILRMLSNYYISKTGEKPPHIGVSDECVNEEGLITIRIYDEDNGKVTNLEWYDVNPDTYMAHDTVFFNEVDLNKYK